MVFEVQATTREETLNLLLREGKSSASNLASSIGISVQAMRRHLRGLQQQGLVQSTSFTSGPGRPSNLWQLTSKGQSNFQDFNAEFALSLLKSAENELQKNTIEALLERQATEKVNFYRQQIGEGPIAIRLKRLLEIRRKEGFLAECEPTPDGTGWFMNGFHCSIRKVAEAFPIVCDQELEVIRQSLPDCAIERVQWRLQTGHACGFHIIPNSAKSGEQEFELQSS